MWDGLAGFHRKQQGYLFPQEKCHIPWNAAINTAKGCSSDWSNTGITDGLYQLTMLTHIIRFFIWGFIITVNIWALSSCEFSYLNASQGHHGFRGRLSAEPRTEVHKATVRLTKGFGDFQKPEWFTQLIHQGLAYTLISSSIQSLLINNPMHVLKHLLQAFASQLNRGYSSLLNPKVPLLLGMTTLQHLCCHPP